MLLASTIIKLQDDAIIKLRQGETKANEIDREKNIIAAKEFVSLITKKIAIEVQINPSINSYVTYCEPKLWSYIFSIFGELGFTTATGLPHCTCNEYDPRIICTCRKRIGMTDADENIPCAPYCDSQLPIVPHSYECMITSKSTLVIITWR